MVQPNYFDLPPVKLVSASKPNVPPKDFRESRIAEYFRSRELSNNSKRAYNRAFNRFLGWTEKSWHDISDRDLDRYKLHLKELKLKPNSICQELSALKSIFKWLYTKRYIDRNPTSILELPKVSPVIEDKSLSHDQIESLKAKLKDDKRDYALFWVLFHGLRREEICNLTLADYQQDSLLVRNAKHGSDRSVPLLNEAIEALDEYLWEREKIDNCDALFLSRLSRQEVSGLTTDGLYYLCQTWGDFTPHQSRHTLCQRLIDNGMDTLLAMQITGHKSANSFKKYSDRALQNKAAQQFRKLSF